MAPKTIADKDKGKKSTSSSGEAVDLPIISATFILGTTSGAELVVIAGSSVGTSPVVTTSSTSPVRAEVSVLPIVVVLLLLAFCQLSPR
ncbi:uncharacterized protein A4U43_C09F11870 [Asparagus officinalis]|uniref:Uncharacterized protein n=1 Tax=Asparagus officinalis TaxID=4686 RepID=A0A5P1E8X2_ASPOF|nr:uncharacterized protein A4U43_C09F11870 [Asparagus officinalis]